MKCNYCGTEFEGNFCPKCGAKIESETNYQQPMQGTAINPAKKKKPFYQHWWFIAIVVLAIGSAAISIGKSAIKNIEYKAFNTTSDENEKTGTETQESDNSSEKTKTSTNIRRDFKEAMDSYEEFLDEYVSFMKKYTANPTDTSLIEDYANYMSKLSYMAEKFNKWNSEDLNADELAYYLKVQARATKKMIEVSQ